MTGYMIASQLYTCDVFVNSTIKGFHHICHYWLHASTLTIQSCRSVLWFDTEQTVQMMKLDPLITSHSDESLDRERETAAMGESPARAADICLHVLFMYTRMRKISFS